MKFLRYGKPGAEKPGLLDKDGRVRNLSNKIKDLIKLAKLNKKT